MKSTHCLTKNNRHYLILALLTSIIYQKKAEKLRTLIFIGAD